MAGRRVLHRLRKPPPATPTGDGEGPRRVDADAVTWAYRLLFGRDADPGGQATNLGFFAGQPLDEMVVHFLTCPEFRAGALYHRTRDFRHQRPTWVELDGFSMWVCPDDVDIGAEIAAEGAYEPHVTAAVKEALRPGDTFVDIGANIGWFTLLAASIVGSSGAVVAVEPNPGNLTSLTNSITGNGFTWVEILPYAAGSEVATTRLAGGRGTNAYFDTQPTAKEDGWRDFSLVPVRPLDDLLDGIGRLDVLKVDVEGAEGLVVDGAAVLLRSLRPTILCEFSPASLLERSGRSGERFVDQLIELGYEVAQLAGPGGRVPLPDGQAALRAHAECGGSHLDLVCSPRPPV